MAQNIRQRVERLLRQTLLNSPTKTMEDVRAEVADRLVSEGYKRSEIERALSSIEPADNAYPAGWPDTGKGGVPLQRVFTPLETLRLTPAARGYLMEMERNGLIEPIDREEIIERALMLPVPEVGIEHLQVAIRSVLGEDSAGPYDGTTLYH